MIAIYIAIDKLMMCKYQRNINSMFFCIMSYNATSDGRLTIYKHDVYVNEYVLFSRGQNIILNISLKVENICEHFYFISIQIKMHARFCIKTK